MPTDGPGVRAAIKGLLFESVCPIVGGPSRSRVVGTDDMEELAEIFTGGGESTSD